MRVEGRYGSAVGKVKPSGAARARGRPRRASLRPHARAGTVNASMSAAPLRSPVRPPLERVWDWLRARRADWRDARTLAAYARHPAVPPPHAVKARAVVDAARAFGLRTLVETGTYEGEMVRKALRHFTRIVTLELDAGNAARAARRFAGDDRVEVWQGDSATLLPEVLRTVPEPAVFWLDGHFSGAGTARGSLDTPLAAELATLARRGNPRDIVLIDDARMLGEGDYPSVEQIARAVAPLHPGGSVRVEDDIVRCLPAVG